LASFIYLGWSASAAINLMGTARKEMVDYFGLFVVTWPGTFECREGLISVDRKAFTFLIGKLKKLFNKFVIQGNDLSYSIMY